MKKSEMTITMPLLQFEKLCDSEKQHEQFLSKLDKCLDRNISENMNTDYKVYLDVHLLKKFINELYNIPYDKIGLKVNSISD